MNHIPQRQTGNEEHEARETKGGLEKKALGVTEKTRQKGEKKAKTPWKRWGNERNEEKKGDRVGLYTILRE